MTAHTPAKHNCQQQDISQWENEGGALSTPGGELARSIIKNKQANSQPEMLWLQEALVIVTRRAQPNTTGFQVSRRSR